MSYSWSFTTILSQGGSQWRAKSSGLADCRSSAKLRDKETLWTNFSGLKKRPYHISLPAPVGSFSEGITMRPMSGIENMLANQGIVWNIIALGRTTSADSNHLSTSSSCVKQPQGRPNAISHVVSIVKKETFRAMSIGLNSAGVDMYFLLIKFTNARTCVSIEASRLAISFPEYWWACQD